MRESPLHRMMLRFLPNAEPDWRRRGPVGPGWLQTSRRFIPRLELLEDRTVLSPLQLISPVNALLPASAGAGNAATPEISANGQYIVYSSTAPNLVTGQSNTAVVSNIYLYDQSTQTTVLVSHVAGQNTLGADGNSTHPWISGDGHFIAYESTASDLVQGLSGTPGVADVYLYNSSTGVNTLISHRFNSTTTSADSTSETDVTTGFGFTDNSGQFLLFYSYATDLVANLQGPLDGNLYLANTTTGAVTLVSHAAASSSTVANDDAETADITPDGDFIVYMSLATNVVSGETGPGGNIFLYNTQTGAAQLISGVAGGFGNSSTEGAGDCFDPLISADGHTIIYFSFAEDLIAGQGASNNSFDVYSVYSFNTETDETTLVSSALGSPTTTSNDDALVAAVSNDGSTIAFVSKATNLTPGQGATHTPNVFVYDTSSGSLTLASHTNTSASLAAGDVTVNVSPNDISSGFGDLSISDNGQFVAYQSTAANIAVNQPANQGVDNVFLYNSLTNANTFVSHVNGSPTISGNQDSDTSALSVDGSTIAFLSSATNLVPGATIDTAGEDVFVSSTGGTGPALVSKSAFSANATSLVYGSSSDGNYVVFISNEPNVVPGEVDNNDGYNVYLVNRSTNTTTLVNHIPGALTATGDFGIPDTNDVEVSPPVISANGDFVAFESRADDLVGAPSAGTPGTDNVYLYNRLTGKITLLSHAVGSPAASGNEDSFYPQINADGSFVSFISLATNLVQGFSLPPAGFLIENLYEYNSSAGTNTLVSHDGNNALASSTADVQDQSISDDGNFIAYTDEATNLLPTGTASQSDVYLYNRSTNTNALIDHIPGNDASQGNDASFDEQISADGDFVVFVSFATDLVSPNLPATGFCNVFLYDRLTDVISLVSGQDGSPSIGGNGFSVNPAIDEDGGYVVFRSDATNLVQGQNGPTGSNIFLYNGTVSPSTLTLVSAAQGTTTTTASGDSTDPAIDGDGSLVAFLSTATNLVAGQSGGGVQNVFGSVTASNRLFLASGVNGSPTQASPFPAFLPIISRDPIILFSVAGALQSGVTGYENVYANTFVSLSLSLVSIQSLSPVNTQVGSFLVTSVFSGQLALPSLTLPAGGAAGNADFSIGPIVPSGSGASTELVTAVIFNLDASAAYPLEIALDLNIEGLAPFMIPVTLNASTQPVPAVQITTWPTNEAVVVGNNITFTAAASGTPTPTVQWEVRAAGATTFTPVAGQTSPTLTLSSVPQSDSGNQYEAVFTSGSNQATTNIVTLTVSQVPLASVSGFVYSDYNLNGALDTGERGLAGQTVFLDLNGNGIFEPGEPSTTTSSTGAYSLTNLLPGKYVVRQALLGGVLLTEPAGNSYSVTVASGTTLSNENLGDVLTSITVPLTTPATSPFPAQGNANADFVEAVYRAILDRNADSAGLAGWVGELNNGTPRLQVVEAIRNSPEHFTQEVNDFYLTLLGRAADPAGLAAWVALLEKGMREEQVAFDFLDSPEFLSKGDKNFVDSMYESLLGRAFDPAGEQSWLNALGDNAAGTPTHAATETHAQVIDGFLYSTESLQRLVQGYYQVFLQRPADTAGLNTWVQDLSQQGLPFVTIGEEFIASAEFFNKAAANG